MEALKTERDHFQAAETKILHDLANGDTVQQWVAKTSRASGIESLYTGMENALKLVLKALGERIDADHDDLTRTGFHARLLERAASTALDRPAVISAQLYQDLDELRRFRHLQRNVYGSSLRNDRVNELMKLSIEAVDRFSKEIEVYKAAIENKS